MLVRCARAAASPRHVVVPGDRRGGREAASAMICTPSAYELRSRGAMDAKRAARVAQRVRATGAVSHCSLDTRARRRRLGTSSCRAIAAAAAHCAPKPS